MLSSKVESVKYFEFGALPSPWPLWQWTLHFHCLFCHLWLHCFNFIKRFRMWENAKVNVEEPSPLFSYTFCLASHQLPLSYSCFLTSGNQWSTKVLGNFSNRSIKILLILKRLKNFLYNIFINVNKVQNTYTLRCNLIFIIVCSKGPTNFCCSCKNVVLFFKPNPLASTCACFTLCLLILVWCLSHFVNFASTLFGHTFRNHGPSFIKLIGNLHPITLSKTFFFNCQTISPPKG